MFSKEVCLYDSHNRPLKVPGIDIYLCDALTGTIYDRKLSQDLNPGQGGSPSDTWGVRLDFPAGRNPVDIFTTDTTYTYPGNALRYLNGELDDRIDLDLLSLPPSPGGQSNPPASPMPSDLARWIKEGHLWNAEQKRAVHNLTFNYLSVILPHLDQHGKKSALNKIAENWEKALTNLHIIPDMLLTISKVPVIQEVARSH